MTGIRVLVATVTVTASLATEISLCAVIVYNHRLGRRKWCYNRSIKPAPGDTKRYHKKSPTNINLNKGEKQNKQKHSKSKKLFNWLLMVEIYKNTEKHAEHQLLPSLWCHEHGTLSVT